MNTLQLKSTETIDFLKSFEDQIHCVFIFHLHFSFRLLAHCLLGHEIVRCNYLILDIVKFRLVFVQILEVGLIVGRNFVFQKCLGLHLEGILSYSADMNATKTL